MINVITGDIIDSRKVEETSIWQKPLKAVLNKYGKSPETWEIYRGDSFQLKTNPDEGLLASILIKSAIKQINPLDVRIALGIGEEGKASSDITEASGNAFINSGETYEKLKEMDQRIVLKTPWPEIDESINLLLKFALIIMDNWTPNSAALMKAKIEHPNYSQQQLGKEIGKSQSSISEQNSRGHLNLILEFEKYYRKTILAQIKHA